MSTFFYLCFMIVRSISEKLLKLWKVFPVVTITGPRQSGKTTLIRNAGFDLPYISLEDIDVRQLAADDPRGFLANYPKGAILDEVQNVPQLFSYIQTEVDSSEKKYVLSGSQNFELIENISQSLAGRTAIIKLLPFSLTELESNHSFDRFHEYLFQGSYPRLYDKGIDAVDYYPSYINTYIQRDVRLIKNIENLALFTKFVRLCAGRIGQPLNVSNLANDTGVSPNTAQSWLSILEASYIIHFLQPYHTNYSKRLIKSPKLYFFDTGVACSLLGLASAEQLASFHLVGGLFENMVVNEFLKNRWNQGLTSNLYFWQDRNRKEIDLIIDRPDGPIPIEIKSGSTMTKSYFKNLTYWRQLSGVSTQEAFVVYGGETDFKIGMDTLVSWSNLSELYHKVGS